MDVILLIVKLAGLADGDVSGVLTCGKVRGSPTLAEKLAMLLYLVRSRGNRVATPLLVAEIALPPGTFKSIS